MEAATAELDKLAVMLKQMQEDIKAIPSDSGREASHPLPTSPAPPHARKSFSNRRSILDAAAQSSSLTPRRNGSVEVPSVDTPDNDSLDKVEKMQETSTTVTVAGARGVRRPLHAAVAEEAQQGFGQPTEALSETSEVLSKMSVKHSDASAGLSKTSVKHSDASAGLSKASVKASESAGQAPVKRNGGEVGSPAAAVAAAVAAASPRKQDAAGGEVQAKGKAGIRSRSKRMAAEKEGNQQGAPREKRQTMDPQTVKAGSSGSNHIEGNAPAPVESQPQKATHGGEVNSVCLQPTEDDLVRVAVVRSFCCGRMQSMCLVSMHVRVCCNCTDLTLCLCAAG